MKVGKEGILGAMAALEFRMALDVGAWTADQDRKMYRIIDRMSDLKGVGAGVEPDPNGNPFSRARLDIDTSQAGISAAVLIETMADGDPSIRLRGHHVDEGYFMVDAIEMSDAEVDLTCERLLSLLTASASEKVSMIERFGGGRSEPKLSGLR